MENLQQARKIIESTQYVFAAVGNGHRLLSSAKGISRLLEYIQEGESLENMSVADSVVGKAAALMMVKLKVYEVYAKVISKPALSVFEKHKIPVSCGEVAEFIVNRKGDGMCPMEASVLEIDDADEAYGVLVRKVEEMRGKK